MPFCPPPAQVGLLLALERGRSHTSCITRSHNSSSVPELSSSYQWILVWALTKAVWIETTLTGSINFYLFHLGRTWKSISKPLCRIFPRDFWKLPEDKLQTASNFSKLLARKRPLTSTFNLLNRKTPKNLMIARIPDSTMSLESTFIRIPWSSTPHVTLAMLCLSSTFFSRSSCNQ